VERDEAIRQAERAVWAALVAGDAAADLALLSDDFLGAYPDGFSGRAAHCAQLAEGPSVAAYAITEEHLRPLGPDHMLYAYRACYRRPGAEASEEMLVSSIWERRDTGWINIFSQDTPLTGTGVP
jgi:hypothetical protein